MTIQVVQSKTGSGSGTSLTITLGSNTSASNCLVVCAGCPVTGIGNRLITGITLGGSSDHFAQGVGLAVSGTSGVTGEIWTDQNCAGSQSSVVLTFSSSATASLATIYEVSGLFTS